MHHSRPLVASWGLCVRFWGVLDVRRKGTGERLSALHQDAQLAGGFLEPLDLRLQGVPLAVQIVGEALEADHRRRASLGDLRGRVGRCVQGLRDLAQDLATPVLAVAMVNRQVYAYGRARPGMASLKGFDNLA